MRCGCSVVEIHITSFKRTTAGEFVTRLRLRLIESFHDSSDIQYTPAQDSNTKHSNVVSHRASSFPTCSIRSPFIRVVPCWGFGTLNRACKSRARKRGWGQLGAGGPYSPC